jgi:predicted nucleic acid-binding protein
VTSDSASWHLLVDDHVHHVAAENWFVGLSGYFATCPVTQGSLMRLLIREGQSAVTAQAVLNGATADTRNEFWPDDVDYTDVPIQGIIGHRQVTDAYLAQLARARGSRFAIREGRGTNFGPIGRRIRRLRGRARCGCWHGGVWLHCYIRLLSWAAS